MKFQNYIHLIKTNHDKLKLLKIKNKTLDNNKNIL